MKGPPSSPGRSEKSKHLGYRTGFGIRLTRNSGICPPSMDGYSQHNQPLPPLPPELQQNPPGYRRPSGSSAIPQPTQRGQAIPTFEGPVESFLQQQFLSGHLPGHLPRNMRPTIPQQYSDSTFTPIYGEPPAYTPQVLPQMPQVHFQGPYLGQAVNVPVWQPDNLVRTCPICNVAFTFYFRRHHCR